MKKPKMYKFSFYACESIYNNDKRTKEQLKDEIDNAICYCDSITIVSDLDVETLDIKMKGGK